MTRRVVSVWLPHWPTDRLARGRNGPQPAPRDGPLALIHASQGGMRLIAVNKAASVCGLRAGLLLADARAMVPELRSLPHDPEAEVRDLEALARWCGRFSPQVSTDPPDGLWLDVTGVTHLFGGEVAFLETLRVALSPLGLASRVGLADTPGAAWAVARFGTEPWQCVAPGEQKQALAPLSVAALRLSSDTANQLERLGLKRVGQLYGIASASFRPRFGETVTRRLNQALGWEKESISPLVPEPDYYAALRFPEPIGMLSDVNAVVDILAGKVSGKLTAHGKGACRFVLTLYGATGGCFAVEVGTSGLVREAEHIKRLFRERLIVLENRFDPSFGADAFSLHAHAASRLDHAQTDIANGAGNGDIDQLVDRLRARLGRDAVFQLDRRESHIPERAVVARRAGAKQGREPPPSTLPASPRPLLLLPRPEPIRAIAEVPDYPPHRFQWRKVTYSVVRAEGPERVTAEWWREKPQGDYRTRDYFRVEDPTGARFWIYRLGLLERHEGPVQWYLHGIFA